MLARLFLVASIVTLWCITPLLAQDSERAANLVRRVPSDEITVSLSIYLTSVISTAIATWIVARYDRTREKQLDELKHDLNWMRKRMNAGDGDPED